MTQPTILLTGAAGQLGFELARSLSAHGKVVALDRASLDIAHPDAIVAMVRSVRPQLIVNAAAYTAVDRAETEETLANAINATAPGVLGEEAKRLGAVLIHYSTDYVFDGGSAVPYDEEAPARPLNAYGRSKFAGEQAALGSAGAAIVLRTSWIYGLRGSNFLLTMRKLAATRDELRVVADQTGVPNWTRTLAEATARIVGQGLPGLADRAGLYHMSCSGSTSWFGLASAIVGSVGRPRVVPITTAEYPTPARRPPYAVLNTVKFERMFGFTLPEWSVDLKACLASGS